MIVRTDDDVTAPEREQVRVGGHYEAPAVRAARGWRLSRSDFHPVWTSSVPPMGATI
jgi:hypothetical protein